MTLRLRDMGAFHVGGRMHRVEGEPTRTLDIAPSIPAFPYDPNGDFAVGHAYCQYFIPEDARGLPILLIHGGALTGACWETTPDGREGWANRLLRRGRRLRLPSQHSLFQHPQETAARERHHRRTHRSPAHR